MFAASIFFAVGGVITSQALTLSAFLLGRAIQGIGGAGIMTVSFILVLELSGKKRRGLFIGLVNTGFTTGVSIGAVVAGALLPVTGWVGHQPTELSELMMCRGSCSGFKALLPSSSEQASSSVSPHPSRLEMRELEKALSFRNLAGLTILELVPL